MDYPNFISEFYSSKDLTELAEQLERDYIVTLPDFISPEVEQEILASARSVPEQWWTYATRPEGIGGIRALYSSMDDSELPKRLAIVNAISDLGHFCYRFKRTTGGHYAACNCYGCCLQRTFEGDKMRGFLAKLTQAKDISLRETFVSRYERGDFITIHHDKDKGDYTFVLSLTKSWNPAHGGVTHFWNAETENIYKSVSPRFGTLTIFKLSKEHQMDHFVSTVTGPGKRDTYTGWFNSIREPQQS